MREERVTEKIDDLPVLVTCPSGTSAMLSSEVNGAVAERGEKSRDISGSIISTLRNLTRILIRILILLLGGLLVLLTFIELLTNHGSGTGVQGMATAANITRSERKRY